jgi:acetylserotonin N-methyltransferase
MSDANAATGTKAIPDRASPWSDQPVWDVWLSILQMPALAAADEVRLFDHLRYDSLSTDEISERLDLNLDTLKALLPMLAALGFLRARDGRYELTPVARSYLLTDSPYYWGHAFSIPRNTDIAKRVSDSLRGRQGTTTHADGWESGQIPLEMGRQIAGIMNSHSVPAALGLASLPLWRGTRHLLDVGGGSGCYAIALAKGNPGLKTTVMDLPSMCTIAQEYISDSGADGLVDTAPVDMFRQEWPRGHDACFFSNVFHDWNAETNGELAAKAFGSLPSGGAIHLHEMLIADDGSGPLIPACFSMLMRVGTRGRQYSAAEFRAILEGAGFRDVRVTDAYGYYSLVSATKP